MRTLLDSAWFYFGLAALLALGAVLSQLRLAVPPPPDGTVEDLLALPDRDDLNLVFILVDTLRAARLGAYGYERATSPVMDELASRGIRFETVESQSSWTKASMASLWTGIYPERTGITRYNQVIPEEATLPAERFRDAGFLTAGLWRNGWVAPNFGFGQGFDLYVKPRPSVTMERVRRRTPGSSPLRGTDLDLTESAMEFIQSNRDERFFAYIHYMDVHQYTYDSESNLFGSTYSGAYDNAIHWTDRNIGMLVEGLRNVGILDKTMIVIASDHGESFLEHHSEGHAKHLYREVQEVPLIIVPPFLLPEPVVVKTRVANIDVFPTIMDLFGLPALEDAEGRSLLPLILEVGRGHAEVDDDRVIFGQLDRWWGKPQREPAPIISAVRGPYRLQNRIKFPNRLELFDHRSDPAEQTNVVDRQPEIRDELMAEVEAFLAEETKPWERVEEVELDAMMLHQLRALGYAVEEK